MTTTLLCFWRWIIHPPCACGIGFRDDIGLTNRDALCEFIVNYSGKLRVVCGLIHTTIVGEFAGRVTSASDRRTVRCP